MTEEYSSAEAETPEEEAEESPKKERYRVAGEKLLSKVKELIQEGNIRRITIKNDDLRRGERQRFLVQRMADGIEMAVGVRHHPSFGSIGQVFFPTPLKTHSRLGPVRAS